MICSPNNFVYDEPLAEGDDADHGPGQLRPLGRRSTTTAYRLEKLRWYDRIVASAVRFVPDFRGSVIDTDMFTPTTIRRFTGHDNGAVYGAAEKQLRRHDPPGEPVHLRHRPGVGGHRRQRSSAASRWPTDTCLRA